MSAIESDDIGEQNGPDSRVALVSLRRLNERGARSIHFTAPRNLLRNLGRDLDNLRRDQAMRFTMHRGCRLRTRCAAEAENLAAALVEPVLVILDAILPLRFDIRAGAPSQRLPR